MPIDNPGIPLKTANGQWTGNGTDNRQITMGFKPRIVHIWAVTFPGGRQGFIRWPTGGVYQSNAGWVTTTDVTTHASYGIEVDGAVGHYANVAAEVYLWVGIE